MTRSSRRPSRSRGPARRKSNTSTYIGIAVVAAVLLAAIGFALARTAGPNVGERVPDQGQGLHLQNPDDTPPVAWNSNPPTSGYHWGGGTAPWGIHSEPIQDTLTVHNIEHGGVIIHYRQGLDQASVDRLTEIARGLLRQNPCVVMVPRPADQIDAPVVLTAWNYLLRLQSVDEAAIRAFFNAHIGRGPEAACRP
ncbi:MAG TPA: DUF3105 domain-containing protein [Roseiflexaceae bacterium]|nr:DUF3105 domain-containing protein [Roseiflexaceae bacterium]